MAPESRNSWRSKASIQPRYSTVLRSTAAALILALPVSLCAAAAGAPTRRVWTRAELAREIAVQERHMPELMRWPGVVGTGVTVRDGVPAIVIFTADGEPLELPKQLDGVPVVVRTNFKVSLIHGGTGCTAYYPGTTKIIDGCHDDLYNQPVPMGASTSTILATGTGCDAGTLGFKACDAVTFKPGYVTAGHVGTKKSNGCEGAPIGTKEVHLGIFESYPDCDSYNFEIGTLAKWVTVVAGSPSSPNTVDAAWVLSKDSQTRNKIIDIPEMALEATTPAVHACVRKSGRTSGVTRAEIDAINVATSNSGWCLGGSTPNQTAYWGGLFLISYNSGVCGGCTEGGCAEVARGGDSGSAIVDNSSVNKLYGLLVFNAPGDGSGEKDGLGIPAATVLSALNLKVGNDCL